jgi:DNA-binding CsgD family transcriptional regulator
MILERTRMAQRTTSQETPDRAAKSSDLISLLAAVGFALFWAVVVLLLGSALNHYSALCLFVGFAAVQYCSYSRFAGQPVGAQISFRVAVGAALLALPYLSLLLVDIDSGTSAWLWSLLPWLCFGVSAGLILPGWGTVWTGLDALRPDNHATSLHVSIAVIGAAIFAAILYFLPNTVQQVAVFLFYLGSIALLLFCSRQLPAAEFIDLETSKKHLTLFSRMMLAPFLMGASASIVVGLSLAWFGASATLVIVISGVALAGILMAITLAIAKHVPRHSTLERWIIPVLAVLLVAAIVASFANADQALLFALFAALIADLSFSFISHWNVLTALSYRHNVHAVFHYMQGLIAPLSGTAAGILVCISLFSLELTSNTVLLVVFLGLLLLLILVNAISPYASNKTVDTVFENADNEEMSGHWRTRCKHIAEQFALSPREIEVFQLLAKGRNAEYISKTLFISLHTVKTHISRIYRKLLINSQQELIDLVDSA